ncbi:MAG: PEP-CTERM sorting domain-containing protein [Planctomycetes bacterium]|nr:PEP-CTERM sorting domain-containing protein [Planctomycetota bacterium]
MATESDLGACGPIGQREHGPGPLDSWTVSNFGGTNTYSIELSGVQFIPAPGAMALFGLGGLLAMRRRRG